MLSNFSFSKDTVNLDVRVKAYVHFKTGKELIICMDRFNIQIDGELINHNNTIADFLKSAMR